MDSHSIHLSRINESNGNESCENPAEPSRPIEPWSKPKLQIITAPYIPKETKATTNGYQSSHSSTPKSYRIRSETSSTVNHTPSWHTRPTHRVKVEAESQSEQAENRQSHSRNEEQEHPIESLDSLNSDAGESSILEDLEAKVGFGSLGGAGQDNLAGLVGFGAEPAVTASLQPGVMPNSSTDRGRSASVTAHPADLLGRMRMGRKLSQESVEYLGFDYINRQSVRSTLQYCCVKLVAIAKYLTPNIYDRLNAYLLVFFLVVISFLTRRGRQMTAMVRLYAASVLLEFACSVGDRIVYRLIDFVFASRFDVAYQLHALNGPLGWLVTIFIMRSYFNHSNGLDAEALFPTWRSILTAAAVIVICLAGKNWLTHKQYVHLLEARYTSKVENLNTMVIILSELASTRPPKSVQLKRTNTTQTRRSTSESSGTGVSSSGTVSTLKERVKNVFADLVQDTEEELQHEEVITRRELYRKRRSFWQSAARLNATAGRMKVITYNGIVNIHNQGQAKEFGRKLYKHLSKGGKVVITPELIRKLFEERRALFNQNREEQDEHDLEMAEVVTGRVSQVLWESEGEAHDLWARAAALFDPYNLGRISEDFCVEAVLNIYKEQRFTAASISNFGELHQSLRIGIDILYWIVMLFVLQNIFGFDINNYILPFITLLVSFSFAISSLVGNVFLSFAFVFFMKPFEVGHKVQIGLISTSLLPPVGYVKSVSLMYTVITTSVNETVKIPNCALWSEKIYNLTETTGAVHEFILSFNLHGAGNADHNKIQLLLTRLKHYTLRETQEWKSFFVAATAMDETTNTMEYRVYCTHREGWGFYQAAATARIEYYATIKRLCEVLGLVYVKVTQPVEMYCVGGSSGSNGSNGAGYDDSGDASAENKVRVEEKGASEGGNSSSNSNGKTNIVSSVEGQWRQRSNAIGTPTSGAGSSGGNGGSGSNRSSNSSSASASVRMKLW